MALERGYQPKLIKRIRQLLPGCYILKNDPSYLQGVPDILILWESHWALLEVKRAHNSKRRPNQSYHVDKLNEMSFAAFICPENEAEVLIALQQAFGIRR